MNYSSNHIQSQRGYTAPAPSMYNQQGQQMGLNQQGQQYPGAKVFQQPPPMTMGQQQTPQPYPSSGYPQQPQMGGYQQQPSGMMGGLMGSQMGMGGQMGASMGGYQSAPYQQAGGPMMGAPMGGMGAPMGGMGAPMMGAPMGAGGVVSLAKGGNMSLSKVVPNLRQVTVGLGWDVRQTPGAPFDLDASVFMLKADGKVRMPQDLIFYNNKQSVDGSVFHHGDNLTGAGEGDDESISVDLTRVPMDIQKIVCVVSIYEAEQRGQNFGMVQRAFIRVVNSDNKQEIVRFDLTEEASMFNAMVFGELYRYNNEWKFRAVGQGVPGGLRSCGPMFGLAMQ